MEVYLISGFKFSILNIKNLFSPILEILKPNKFLKNLHYDFYVKYFIINLK